MRLSALVASTLFLTLALSGCDGDDECTIGSAEGCDEGLVCESFEGEEAPRCTQPVVIEGMVFDILSEAAIADARVVALDANGAARSGVAFTDAAGNYSLQVSVPRDAEGVPTSDAITLRVDADAYETFPKAPRQALPVEIEGATQEEEQWVVMNVSTNVGLIPLDDDTGSTISGRVDHADPGGVLVVAEQGGTAVSTSITGTDGAFTLYNVPAGSTLVEGFRGGLHAGPVTVEAVADGVTDVILPGTSEGLATVSGSVQIVNPEGGTDTSVILVLESTYNETTTRGETPSGLRAAPVTGAFTIENVPPGRYVVLAAFENDLLVRDPDTSIGGTAIVHITVEGADLEISEGFKVTGGLQVISPGGADVTGLQVVTTVPDLQWVDDSSEDGYELRVYDALGNEIWMDRGEATDTQENLGPFTGGGNPTYSLSANGVTLEPGMIYQFRVWSHKDGVFISATEDLLGVFQYQP
jgi:hypothetical protein